MFLSSFWSTPLIWVPVSFSSLLVPCTFSFVFIGFIFSSGFRTDSTNSVSVLITSVLNCASDRLAISLLLSYIFFWALICSFIWAIFFFFFCLGVSVTFRGGALGVPQGGVMLVAAKWCCTRGAEREQWCLLCSLPVFSHSLHYPQSNWALLVLIPKCVGVCAL